MITKDFVNAEKLRGGYYSPQPLVDLCLARVLELVGPGRSLRALEPSAGDGAFVRGLARNQALLDRIEHFDAIELLQDEAAVCSTEMNRCGLQGSVHVGSAIRWATTTDETYQMAVGNPPYVRFQFLPKDDKSDIPRLESRIGLSFRGVSNLWLPLLLGSLTRLSFGGAFAFIVPAECFTGVSAGVLRQWLVGSTANLRFDLFPPGSFPGVLQEVVVLSGTRAEPSDGPARCEIREHSTCGKVTNTEHLIPASPLPWTRYLLTKDGFAALEEAADLAIVSPMARVAKFEVAAVTGANDFFSVDDHTLGEFSLGSWSTPLLPRLRHATGLRYSIDDHQTAAASGAKTHLLDFSDDRADPSLSDGPAGYLAIGEDRGIPDRYKCRIREPWYRVPSIRSGRLMMSKRSHWYPKVILNDADVVTTDTIYRGTMREGFLDGERDLASVFHNSLTLLTAEVEGRSFGGGVLELVPSEVGRLLVPLAQGFGSELNQLDALARSQSNQSDSNALVRATDVLLIAAGVGFTPELMERLAQARQSLLERRLARNSS
jgi:adenine-specific DNA-methyltransferase